MNLVSLLIIYIAAPPWVANTQNTRFNSSVQLRRGPGRGGRGAVRDVGGNGQWPRLDNRVSQPEVRPNRDFVRSPRRRQRCRKIEIDNGVTQMKNKGAFVKYFCSSGFHMLGDNYAGCNDQGQWSSAPPVCTRSGCRSIMNPINGAAEYSYGESVVDFYCNDGWRLEGSNILFCNGTNWNSTEPSCERLPLLTILTPPTTTMPPIPIDLIPTTILPEIDIGLNDLGNFSLFKISNFSVNVSTTATTMSDNPVTFFAEHVSTPKLTTRATTLENTLPPSTQPPPGIDSTLVTVTSTSSTSSTGKSSTLATSQHTTNSTRNIETSKLLSTTQSTITTSTRMTTNSTPPTVTSTVITDQISVNLTTSTPTSRSTSTRKLSTSETTTTIRFSTSNNPMGSTTRRLNVMNRTIKAFNKSLCISQRFQSSQCRQFIINTFRNRTRQNWTSIRHEATTPKHDYNNGVTDLIPTTRTTTKSLNLTRGTTYKVETTANFRPTTTTMIPTIRTTMTTIGRTRTSSKASTALKWERMPKTTTIRIDETSTHNFDNTIEQVLKKGARTNVRHELISSFNIDDSRIIEGTKYSQSVDNQGSISTEHHHGSIFVTFASLFCVAISMGMFSFLFYYCWNRHKGIARPSRSESRNLRIIHDTDDDFVYFGTSQL